MQFKIGNKSIKLSDYLIDIFKITIETILCMLLIFASFAFLSVVLAAIIKNIGFLGLCVLITSLFVVFNLKIEEVEE